MKRLSALFALLLASSIAYAQEETGPRIDPADDDAPVAASTMMQQSRSGLCASQPAGSCFQLNTTPPVTVIVGAGGGGDGGGTNPGPDGGGGGGNVSQCPADDGSANAPAGTPQRPTLLARYQAGRTIHSLGCKTPGVDYFVGTTGTLQPPSSISNPAIQITGGNLVRCNQSGANVTLQNIDFRGFGVFIPAQNGCASLTLENVNFGCNPGQVGNSFVTVQGAANFTLRRARVDSHTNCVQVRGTNVSDPIQCSNGGNGSCTIEYVHFTMLTERAVTPGCGQVTMRWNFFDDARIVPGAHQNFLQQGCFGGGVQRGNIVQFNTSFQESRGGAEGFQFYGHSNQVFTTSGPTLFQYNTMIALLNGGTQTMSHMVHGFCHSPANCNQTAIVPSAGSRFSDNFFDPSGAFAAWYPGRGTAQWPAAVVMERNINMNTGANIQPN